MGFWELLLLGVGLSMDAFAVSVCKGLAMQRSDAKTALVCGVWFGFFQALMPVIGFYLGRLFADAIEAVDHWVAFGLLSFVGIRQVYLYIVTHFIANTPFLVGFGYPVGWTTCCIIELAYFFRRWRKPQQK